MRAGEYPHQRPLASRNKLHLLYLLFVLLLLLLVRRTGYQGNHWPGRRPTDMDTESMPRQWVGAHVCMDGYQAIARAHTKAKRRRTRLGNVELHRGLFFFLVRERYCRASLCFSLLFNCASGFHERSTERGGKRRTGQVSLLAQAHTHRIITFGHCFQDTRARHGADGWGGKGEAIGW